jgi:hypothetical protein
MSSYYPAPYTLTLFSVIIPVIFHIDPYKHAISLHFWDKKLQYLFFVVGSHSEDRHYNTTMWRCAH